MKVADYTLFWCTQDLLDVNTLELARQLTLAFSNVLREIHVRILVLVHVFHFYIPTLFIAPRTAVFWLERRIKTCLCTSCNGILTHLYKCRLYSQLKHQNLEYTLYCKLSADGASAKRGVERVCCGGPDLSTFLLHSNCQGI